MAYIQYRPDIKLLAVQLRRGVLAISRSCALVLRARRDPTACSGALAGACARGCSKSRASYIIFINRHLFLACRAARRLRDIHVLKARRPGMMRRRERLGSWLKLRR